MTLIEKLFYSRAGQALAAKAGLPEPPVLRRGPALPTGPIVLAQLDGATVVTETLTLLGVPWVEPLVDTGGDLPRYPGPIGALVVDATGLRTIEALESLRAALRPAVRALEPSGRVIVVARSAAEVTGVEARAVAQALDGINRTIGKELRGGATSNLVYVSAAVTADALASTLAFLLAGRSAFVDGQAWAVDAVQLAAQAGADREAPLAGRIIIVTGAARGIGEAIARLLARYGAQVVAVDVPAAGDALSRVANEVRGTALQLDITAPDAGARIAEHVVHRFGDQARIFGVVHNAGILRDKLLANTDAGRWAAVLGVNLAAQLRINEVLLDRAVAGGLAEGGRLVGIASTSGIAGNRGQTNYAASKAGVVGLVRAMAPELAGRGITVNAVAPGFIETEMTQKIPFLQREIFRRTNSLRQGGRPVDVAETIAYFLDPASQGVTGQVIRVCGQNVLGA